MFHKKVLLSMTSLFLAFSLSLAAIFALSYVDNASCFGKHHRDKSIISKLKNRSSQTQTRKKFEADGFYYFLGKNPFDFEEISHVRIKTRKLKSTAGDIETWELISPSGYLQTNERFNFALIDVTGSQIDFVTEKVNGIQYRLNGCYVDAKYLSLFPQEGEKRLIGTLIRKQDNHQAKVTTFGLGWYGDFLCAF